MNLTSSDIKRFWSKVGPMDENGCQPWTGSRDRKGYGRLNIQRVPELAHRIAWTIVYGPIPEEICVLHRWDNPPCCAIRCLFLGTKADNTADMVAKGRMVPPPVRRGLDNNKTKLRPVDVLAIRQRLDEGYSKMAVARTFDVSATTIYDISTRKSWAWL
jgi:hypothetical protein